MTNNKYKYLSNDVLASLCEDGNILIVEIKYELVNVANDDTYFNGVVSQSLLLESFLFLMYIMIMSNHPSSTN